MQPMTTDPSRQQHPDPGMVASRSGRCKPLRRRAAAAPTAPARSSGPAILGLMLLVALAVQGAAAAHGVGLGFVPVAPVVQAGHRWAGGGRGRQRVVTASSVQEPPRSSVPRSRSGEEEEGGGGNSNGGLGSVLSSLAKQRRLPPIPGAPWGLEPSEQPGQPVLASTPQPFSLETAVLLAPFAFEAYNDPARTEGWWQLGADQNEVAILSRPFLQEAYGGVLRVNVLGLTETRPGGAPVLASKKKAKVTPASMLPPLPSLPGAAGAAAEEEKGGVVEATVTVELGDAFLGTQRLQLNRSTTQGGRFTYTPLASQERGAEAEAAGAFAAFIKDPLQPNQQPQQQQLLRLTLKGEDQAPLGSAWLDLAEVVKGPPTGGQSEAAGTWRWELSLSQPTPPPLASSAAAKAGDDGGSEARQRLAEAALGVRVEVDLEYVKLDRSAPLRPSQEVEGPEEKGEWRGATGCSRDWRELARALGGDAVAAKDVELLAFLENRETDAQVKLWRDARRKRLIVAYRGTEVWKWRDLVQDLKLLQEPWDVRALHRGDASAGGSGATVAAAAVGEAGEAGAEEAVESVDVYTALAAQANRTMLMYNDLDQAMKEVPGWIGGYVEQMLRAFGSSSSASTAGDSPPPSSLLLAEAAAAARHHHQLQEQAAAGGGAATTAANRDTRAPPPVALTAPGLDPTDAREPRAFSPIRPSPTAYPSAAAWAAAPAAGEEEGPAAAAAAAAAAGGGGGAVVADVFIAALDRVVRGLGVAGGAGGARVTSFVQPLTGRVRSVADFQRAFAEVARALGLVSQAVASTSASDEAAPVVEPAGAAAAAAVEESPLVLLPSRFRATFASLVEETLRFMDAKEQAPTPAPSAAAAATATVNGRPAAPFSFSASLLPQADFSARLSQALDQVVLPKLQRRQLQLGLNATAAASDSAEAAGVAAAAATTTGEEDGVVATTTTPAAAGLPAVSMPALDAGAFGNSAEARVHAGFKEAYLSVRERLLELITSAAGGRVAEDGWEILCTGHSMGGALASLQAHDLSVLFPHNRVRMYSFGSPRIGNAAFAREYERANGDSYRIVNEWDVIARFPRGVGLLNNNTSAFNYDHAGKTALLNFAPNVTLWVEGEQEGPCPLRDMQPLRPAVAAPASAAEAQEAAPASSSSVELEPLFLQAEWELLNALFNGAGFTSHLEYRYFEALGAAQRQQQRERRRGEAQGAELALQQVEQPQEQEPKAAGKTAKKEQGAGLLAAVSSAAAAPAAQGEGQPQPQPQQQSSSSSSLGSWFRVPAINPLEIVAAATTGAPKQ